MIKLEKTDVVGLEHAIRGMRNPMNSWDKSDSKYGCHNERCVTCGDIYCNGGMGSYKVGPEDKGLMEKLVKAGTDHRKFMRMITVYVDITAPLYWWKEFDTYKVGTVANSCSTMHKIADKEFTLEDFSCEKLHIQSMKKFIEVIETLNFWRDIFLNGGNVDNLDGTSVNMYEPKNKEVWWQMIQLLPSSYNQKRTVMLNYEVLANIYKSRRNHKLDEWRELCKWIERLPYSWLITCEAIDSATSV